MQLIAIFLLAANLATVNVKFSNGQTLKLDVARSAQDLGMGLVGRDVAPDTGMLFVYPTDTRTRFNLIGYRIPMDILYLDENKTIINLQQNLVPCRTTDCGYDSIWMYRYAIQVPAGTVKRLNLHAGDVVPFELPKNK